MVSRELNFCVVDEGDSVLIDEARVPLVISSSVADVAQAQRCAARSPPRATPRHPAPPRATPRHPAPRCTTLRRLTLRRATLRRATPRSRRTPSATPEQVRHGC